MIIDTDNLNGITLQELALLLLLYDERVDKSSVVSPVKDIDIRNIFDSLSQRGYVLSTIYSTNFNYTPPYKQLSWSLLNKGKQVIAEHCTHQRKSIKLFADKKLVERCDALALKLMEIYPLGTKPGTNLKWRGYPKGVSERLQKVILDGNEFTDEEAIEATKAYIADHNGIYTKMRILPYFIKKNEIIGGEVDRKCDFMSYVQDIKSNSRKPVSIDWNVELR